jgi:hypothetical protein
MILFMKKWWIVLRGYVAGAAGVMGVIWVTLQVGDNIVTAVWNLAHYVNQLNTEMNQVEATMRVHTDQLKILSAQPDINSKAIAALAALLAQRNEDTMRWREETDDRIQNLNERTGTIEFTFGRKGLNLMPLPRAMTKGQGPR